MKKKQVLAVSSALMIGTTTALTGLPTPVMAQENTEVVQEAIVEENKTEQVPVERETESTEVQENITGKEQEETVLEKEPTENAETLKEDLTEESTKQEIPATLEKEVVTENKTVVENKNTEVKAGNVAIDEVHFPDAEFRKYMSDMWDTDHDGELSEEERKKAERLIIYDNPALKSLKGIEYFPNIWQIDCHSTGLTELDLSKNEKLSWLWCGNTAIESLEIRNNPKLDTLICRGCENLETLIIENTPLLEELDCQNTNIADLDVSNFPVLNTLACSNTKITTLDVTHNPALRFFECQENNLDTLDISQNPRLFNLDCDNNNLKVLDISNNPEIALLSCRNNKLSTLDVSKQTHLNSLSCEDNLLTTLDITNNTELKTLICNNNFIKELDITQNSKLQWLKCDSNPIKQLDTTNAPYLNKLQVNYTALTQLDISKNTELASLEVCNTNIAGLDVSNNANLEYLAYIDNGKYFPTWLNIGNKSNLDLDINSLIEREINLTGNTFDLRKNTDSNIDLSKVTITSNGTLDKNTGIVTVKDTSKDVSYKYDCGTNNGEHVFLNVTFKLNDDIPTNTPPTISANDITLNVGDTFDPLKDVTATDKEDGTITLTKDNIIANDVDTSKAGTYHVTYKVTDKNGASTEKTITVIVKQNTGNLNSAPTISANDVTLNVGETFDPLANVTATDKEDGTIALTKDNIIANDVDTSKAGTYHVTYKVTDKNGASTEKTITVIVKQNTGNLNSAPTISANDVTLNVGDTFNPLANVTATDKEDGTIALTKDNIIANDVDTSKAGTYHVTYKVTDKNGASTEKTITVIVKQNTGDLNTAPTISANDIVLNVGNTFDPLANVTATDKEDGTITLTKDNIIANDVDTSKAGTYHVTYKVTDKNGASTEKTITVIVKQNTGDLNTAPTISANDVTLNVGDTFNPLANVTATDKEDGTIALTKDNIIANDVDTSKAGTYHVTYKITDKNGASTEKTITVTVKEKTTNKPVSPQQPQKPNKPTTSTKPSEQKNPVKTGDITNVGLFASMFAGSTGALAVLFGKKRKRNKND